MQELQRGLEELTRRRGAATVVTLFCKQSKLDFQEHVPALITASALPLCLLLRRRGWRCRQTAHARCRRPLLPATASNLLLPSTHYSLLSWPMTTHPNRHQHSIG